MNRTRSSVTNDRDEEATSVDHRVRKHVIPLAATEIMDPAQLSTAGEPTGEYDAVLGHDHARLATTRNSCGARWVRRSWPVRRHVEEKSLPLVVILAALLCTVGVLGYREHQTVRVLRDTLAEITRVQSHLGADDPTGPVAHGGTLQVSSTGQPLAYGQTEPPNRAALERQGADLLAANDFEAALTHYRALMEKMPNEPVFADLVTVLELKRRCTDSKPGGQTPCP